MTCNRVTLPTGLPARELADRLRHAADEIGRHKHVLAVYLAEMDCRRLYQVSGHASTVHFAETQLDMHPRRTREYLQVGRALEELVLVDEAFARGEISWSKLVGLLPVVQRETQEAWVEFARNHTFRELRDEVHSCRPGDQPGEGSDYGLNHRKIVIEAKVNDVTFAMFERARMMLSDNPEQPLDDAELIAELLRRVLDGSPAAEPRSPELLPEPERNHEDVPEPVAQYVRERDGHRCRNCHTAIDLHVHHITARAAGGSNAPSNLLLLCSVCHASIHRGFLLVHGHPERGRIVFTSADGTPVERPPPRSPETACARRA